MGDSDKALKMDNRDDNAQCFDVRGGASSTEVVNNTAPMITSGNTEAEPKARRKYNRKGKGKVIHPKNNAQPGNDDPLEKAKELIGRCIHKEYKGAMVCGQINSYNALLRVYEVYYSDYRTEYLLEEEVLSKLTNNEDASKVQLMNNEDASKGQQVSTPSDSSKKIAGSDKKKAAPREASVPITRIRRNSSTKKGEVKDGASSSRVVKDTGSSKNKEKSKSVLSNMANNELTISEEQAVPLASYFPKKMTSESKGKRVATSEESTDDLPSWMEIFLSTKKGKGIIINEPSSSNSGQIGVTPPNESENKEKLKSDILLVDEYGIVHLAKEVLYIDEYGIVHYEVLSIENTSGVQHAPPPTRTTEGRNNELAMVDVSTSSTRMRGNCTGAIPTGKRSNRKKREDSDYSSEIFKYNLPSDPKEKEDNTDDKYKQLIGLFVCKEFDGVKSLGSVKSFWSERKKFEVKFQNGIIRYMRLKEVVKKKATQEDIISIQRAARLAHAAARFAQPAAEAESASCSTGANQINDEGREGAEVAEGSTSTKKRKASLSGNEGGRGAAKKR